MLAVGLCRDFAGASVMRAREGWPRDDTSKAHPVQQMWRQMRMTVSVCERADMSVVHVALWRGGCGPSTAHMYRCVCGAQLSL